jgi:hypothetical protein
MQIPIMIEPVAGNGYRSRGGEPFDLSAEGATAAEVMSKLQTQLHARMMTGSEVVLLDVPTSEHPLAKFAGMFKDDPLLSDWKHSMREYRRNIDEDPNAL